MNSHPHVDLIDTAQMYLRTIYELEEEGITPLRARIAERLGQSGPTVSQTVARMERDGLLHVGADRHLSLSESGRHAATAVMRKHRLAERLLADVIGLEWDQLHIEACRWEHVISDAVERRLVTLLGNPLVCPHGNPIPGLSELGLPFPIDADSLPPTLSASAHQDDARVQIARISEHLQPDEDLMRLLSAAGVRPGETVTVSKVTEGIQVTSATSCSVFRSEVTDGIYVSSPA